MSLSLMRVYDQACISTESPPAGPPAGLSSRLSPYRCLQLFPPPMKLLRFPKQELLPSKSHQLNKIFWGLPRKFPNHYEGFSEGL